MCIARVKPEIKAKIKSIPVREFSGIDHLPDDIALLLHYETAIPGEKRNAQV